MLRYITLTLLLATLVGRAEESLPLKISPDDRWASFRGSLEMTGQSASKIPEQPELLWTKNMTTRLKRHRPWWKGVSFFRV